MDINATIDVGDNVTGMLERLAQQIGLTADKVFPWYVKQQVLEGQVFFVVVLIALFVFVPLLIFAAKRTDGEDVYVPLCIVSGLAVMISVGALAFGTMDAVTKINNPEFAAVQAMTRHIARMRR